MPDFDNTNRGVLFVNERKEKETQPDYTGTINIEGTDLDLSGWKKTSGQGKKYLSLSVRAKRERQV